MENDEKKIEIEEGGVASFIAIVEHLDRTARPGSGRESFRGIDLLERIAPALSTASFKRIFKRLKPFNVLFDYMGRTSEGRVWLMETYPELRPVIERSIVISSTSNEPELEAVVRYGVDKTMVAKAAERLFYLVTQTYDLQPKGKTSDLLLFTEDMALIATTDGPCREDALERFLGMPWSWEVSKHVRCTKTSGAMRIIQAGTPEAARRVAAQALDSDCDPELCAEIIVYVPSESEHAWASVERWCQTEVIDAFRRCPNKIDEPHLFKVWDAEDGPIIRLSQRVLERIVVGGPPGFPDRVAAVRQDIQKHLKS